MQIVLSAYRPRHGRQHFPLPERVAAAHADCLSANTLRSRSMLAVVDESRNAVRIILGSSNGSMPVMMRTASSSSALGVKLKSLFMAGHLGPRSGGAGPANVISFITSTARPIASTNSR
jgi:hypothetical protein